MRALRAPLVAVLILLTAGCGGDGDNATSDEIPTAQQQEAFCAYFKAHRREGKQQLVGGLIKVAPKAIKSDLQAAHAANEPGFESTKRVKAYIESTCGDPAPEFSTP